MKILFIAPIPLTINGQSKVSKDLLDKFFYSKLDAFLCVIKIIKISILEAFSIDESK